MDIEKRGRMSRACVCAVVRRLRWICGDTSSESVCEESGVVKDLLKGGVVATAAASPLVGREARLAASG